MEMQESPGDDAFSTEMGSLLRKRKRVAESRDDQSEWKCKQHMLAREERHRRRMEEERLCPPSLPAVVHYSDHECSIVAEELKDASKFSKVVQTLLTWIERGEVNRRTAKKFFSMIQSANSHIRRLVNEKAAHDNDLEALPGILIQLEQMVAVYRSASKQKAWEHFTKTQRKNISIQYKQAEEIWNTHKNELIGIRREEEMEMSDDETEDTTETKDTEESALASQAEALKEEKESLEDQINAFRNEVEHLMLEFIHDAREEGLEQQMRYRLQGLQIAYQRQFRLQEEYKRKEDELQKIKNDKMQLEKMLENLKEKLRESLVNLFSCHRPSFSDNENPVKVIAIRFKVQCLAV